jgi:hypothetical protein
MDFSPPLTYRASIVPFSHTLGPNGTILASMGITNVNYSLEKEADMFLRMKRGILVFSVMLALGISISAQEIKTVGGTPLLWEKVAISERDLYHGPGGREMMPVLEGMVYVDRQIGGNNLKFRLREKSGREWIVKSGREAQPEVAANRLLWAIGYPTEIDYIIPKVEIAKWGRYENARFEARPEGVKREGRWSWDENPFKTSNEFAGLRIMMALLNNWDLKDDNTVIYRKDGKLYYAVSDLGASFGRLAKPGEIRSGRSVNKPADYAGWTFIKSVNGNALNLNYNGARADLMRGINVEHGRWLADLLMQLSDKQIEDAFRAANYEPDEVATLASSVRARIAELDKHTRVVVAGNPQ